MEYGDLFVCFDLRLRLETEDPSKESNLIMIDCREINVTRQKIDARHLGDEYFLSESTYIVSGKIEKFANDDNVFLRYMNSTGCECQGENE